MKLPDAPRAPHGSAGRLPWSYDYGYNQANQRTNIAMADGSSWRYAYDSLGQVTSGKRYWADGSLVPAQQYEYAFDTIGNRTLAKVGGDSAGGNLRQAGYYGLNILNQYSWRNVPGTVDVIGVANGSASATINGQSAYRKDEYYQKALSVDNTVGGGVWLAVTVNASLQGNTQTKAGGILVVRSQEVFNHADGNLESDGAWTNSWDGANRLFKMEAKEDVPPEAKRKLEFEYDYLGRRTSKKIYSWNNETGTYVLRLQRQYVYDGWNVIAELDHNNSLLQSYFWGLDLSGSIQGAGGVGGLVAVKPSGGPGHFASYDGNGNVLGLIDGSNGNVSAAYEYGPFGEPIRVTGTIGKANPFRWSTKFTDDETDLVYYGYRYYNPSTGRWLSRDPIGEKGGANLYGFNLNNPISRFDPTGLAPCGGCGEDVTSQLKATIDDIGATFASWTEQQQRAACTSIIGEGPAPVKKAWDILDMALFTDKVAAAGVPQSLQGGSSGECKYTVTVNGKCYYASQVNYAMWGYMNKICGSVFPYEEAYPLGYKWSLPFANALVYGFKFSEYHQTPFNQYAKQAVDFTEFGYTKDISRLQNPVNCTASKRPFAGGNCFKWAWLPNKDRIWP